VSDKAQKTLRIKWARSGIGFNYHQKRIVRSLGLKKLNQEVERPDTAQIRGLVAKVPHLVEIVEGASKAAWTLVPEYTIYPPEAALAKPAETPRGAPADETEKTEAAVSPPLVPLPSRGGKSGVRARKDVMVARAKSRRRGKAQAAAESATGRSDDSAATKVSGSAKPRRRRKRKSGRRGSSRGRSA
jgi:large subunit ribosomal protein L30